MERGAYSIGAFEDRDKPLLSIITVVLNARDVIEQTLLSVTAQKKPEIEYIVIDGGSEDGTIECVRRHEAFIDYWISEKDKGIYDAINKGINASHGHFLYVLNVGDKLLEIPYNELHEARRQNADVAMFEVQLSDGRLIKSAIDYRTRFGNTIHHQGAFYRRDLNIHYDLAYRVYADFDTNQKLYRSGKHFMQFNKVVSYHSLDGISNERKYRHEYYSVIRKNFGLFWVIVGFLYLVQGELRTWLKKKWSSKANHLLV